MMRIIAGVLMALVVVSAAADDVVVRLGNPTAGHDADMLNDAATQAVNAAKASLLQAPKVGSAIKRIGIVAVEGGGANITNLLKSAFVKTSFDVVLTNDADWGPLLDEFARQVKREDVMLKETAHKLRVQGVDAVLYGTVERSAVEGGWEGLWPVRRATVRLMLNMASLSEDNPGSLLWSEPFTGTIVEKEVPVIWIAVAVGGLAGLLLLVSIVRRLATPR